MVPHLKNRADGHLSFQPREGTLVAGDRTDWGRVTARTDPERPIALAGLALPWTLGLAGGAVGDPALMWVVWVVEIQQIQTAACLLAARSCEPLS